MSFIMDNLIAARKAKPMLVVMEQGYARRPGEAAPAPPRPARRPGAGPAAAPGHEPHVQRVRGRDDQ